MRSVEFLVVAIRSRRQAVFNYRFSKLPEAFTPYGCSSLEDSICYCDPVGIIERTDGTMVLCAVLINPLWGYWELPVDDDKVIDGKVIMTVNKSVEDMDLLPKKGERLICSRKRPLDTDRGLF